MILITGGTGIIGTRLTEHFLQKGEQIRLLALPSDKSSLDKHERVKVWYGDISDKENLRGICNGVSTVYHLAAIIIAPDESLYERINAKGTENIISEAKKSEVKHFIYVSSSSVAFPNPTPYSLSKRKAEETVRNSGLNYTIVRPTLAYSKTGGQEFNILISHLKRYPIIPIPGKGETTKRPVYLDDIINGLMALYSKEISYGKTYYFSGAESISLFNFTRLCLRSIGKPRTPILRIPIWIWFLLAKVGKIFMKKLPIALNWHMVATASQPVNLDPQQAEEDLQYKPRRVSDTLPRILKLRDKLNSI